jgi:copper(I)-binding protein
MNKITPTVSVASFASLAFVASAACAHISIDPPVAEAGVPWKGIVRASHGCDSAPTTGIELQLPAGITAVRAQARAGWQLALTPQKVSWTAGPGQSLAGKDAGDFPLELNLPAGTGPRWLVATQRCGAVSMEWSQVPSQGTSTEGMKTPAVLLQVLAPAEAAAWRMRPAVENAWARASLPGQPSSGAYMRITAKEPTKLVGVSSTAGTAQLHEMKLENDVMRMRAAGPVDLPVGGVFELKPGGYHVMLQELKQPLVAGSTVPLTLVFRNDKGVESRTDLRVPVMAQPPAGGGSGHADHKH